MAGGGVGGGKAAGNRRVASNVASRSHPLCMLSERLRTATIRPSNLFVIFIFRCAAP